MGVDFSMIMMILIWTFKVLLVLILSCLGLVLLALLLVLFAPIRYQLKATIEETMMNHHVRGSCTWLWGIIHIPCEIKEGEIDFKIKLLGFVIYPKKTLRVKSQKVTKGQDKTEQTSSVVTVSDIEGTNTCSTKMDHGSIPIKNDEQENLRIDTSDINEHKGAKWGGFDLSKISDIYSRGVNLLGKPKYYYNKFRKTNKKLKWHFKQLCDMIKRAIKGKETIVEFFGKDRHKLTLRHLKKELLFIWNHSRPKKLTIDAKFGFNDPAITGQIMALLGMALPFIGEYDLNIMPYFEEEIIEMNCLIKGRVYLYHILLATFRVVREKENRLTYRAIKRLKF